MSSRDVPLSILYRKKQAATTPKEKQFYEFEVRKALKVSIKKLLKYKKLWIFPAAIIISIELSLHN